MKLFIKRFVCVMLSLLLLCFLVTIAFAHSGKTDGNGGHYDRSTGEYHYHHGYPAHQHAGGECPYDFKDNINYSSSSSTSNYNTKSNDTSIDKESLSEIFFYITIAIWIGLYILFAIKEWSLNVYFVICLIITIVLTALPYLLE